MVGGITCSMKDCEDRTSSRHRFPNAEKYPKCYQEWVRLCQNTKLATMDPKHVYRCHRVCHSHFRREDIYSNMLLIKTAVPSRNLPNSSAATSNGNCQTTFTSAESNEHSEDIKIMAEVIVLFEGYNKECQTGIANANCTSTLIKGSHNIIVDTMTAWDGEKLKDALKLNGLDCSDINYVICTHGHSDHIGCNYLFQNATHIVGFDINHKDIYTHHDFRNEDLDVNECVTVIATPGHTSEDVSILVKTKQYGLVAIAGDLFESESDLETPLEQLNGVDKELQNKNRKKILKIADYVIPGHGPMFQNKKKPVP